MSKHDPEEIRQGLELMKPAFNRRDFIRGGVAGATTVSLSALIARRAGAAELPYSDDYGAVAPVNDQVTGLPLIALPAGFTYKTYGWTGQPMADGQLTPGLHDGMDVIAAKGSQIVLIRNHEQGGSGIVANGLANYDSPTVARGGTSNLTFDAVSGKWLSGYMSLGGTIRNCAGGRTPWGTWITCEETNDLTITGIRHGWHFEVPAYGKGTGLALKPMGRSSWEAVAVDPATGHVFMTEDTTPSAFYKFVPNQYGNLAAGGTLWALKVKGTDNYNFSGLGNVYVDFPVGQIWETDWVQVTDPEGINTFPIYNSAPTRACFSRLEGCWYDSGKIYFASTNGGVAKQGQVFVYDPRREELTLVFNSTGPGTGNTQCNNPDNVGVSPRGGIVLCEDGGNSIQRLRGLTMDGGTFIFSENRIVLNAAQIAQADAALGANGNVIAKVAAGSYTGQEWCGVCFYQKWMFVNIQTPGITFAITGPWDNGAL